MNQCTVLCVDDDPASLRLYQVILACHGYAVISASNGWEALQLLHKARRVIRAVVLDYEMPGLNGSQLAREIKLIDPTLPVMMLSGNLDAAETARPFLDAVLEKGTPWEKTLDCLDELLRMRPQVAVDAPISQSASA